MMKHPEPILLAHQVKWNQETAPLAVMEKGRRTGISWGEAAEDARLAAKDKKSGGDNVWYVSYNKEMTEQFVKDVADWARIYNLAAGEICEEEEIFLDGDEKKSITVYRVKFASGHKVTGMVSHPRVLRSKQGKVVLDEAAFVDDLAELLKAALALIIWGSVVRVISTHNGENNAFNQLIQDIRAGKYPGAVVHRVPFRLAVQNGLYRRVCRKQGIEWTKDGEEKFLAATYGIYGVNASEELDCIPSQGAGRWLTRNIIENCMDAEIPVIRWEPPADDFVDWPRDMAAREVHDWCVRELSSHLNALPAQARSYLGEDFGRSGDLTSLWPLLELTNLSLTTPFVLELRNAPFRVQKQILYYVLDRLPNLGGVALDARGNGQYLAEVTRQDYGGPDVVHEVMLSLAWYREHMPRLKSALEDRTVPLPKDADVLADFLGILLKSGVACPPDGAYKGVSGQRHYDAVVALAMALYAHAVIEFIPDWEPPALGGGSTVDNMMRGYK